MSLASLPPGTGLEVLPEDTDGRAGAIALDAPVLVHHHERDRYRRLVLRAPDIAARALPGQFVMITPARAEESWPVLPRPMAVYEADPGAGEITIVYGVVGEGTRRLSGFRPGESLVTVGPLGRPFSLPERARSLLVLGRGIGTCSLTMLAFQAVDRGLAVTAVASGRHPTATVGGDVYRAHGITCHEVYDSDGSSAPERLRQLLEDDRVRHGNSAGWDAVAVCGSGRLMALARELGRATHAEVLVALETRMACGLGYCHGCSAGERSTAAESPLICRDGPVFRLVDHLEGTA
ncbi:dihydroorotate oxidase electron transfer subunit [Streptomyces chartreusis]|uniref:iron-sulfur cluster-binding protein n=1 Tax=Streptomyces chartreusis TaxID=1969 RepID=UPI0033B41551